MRKLFEYLEESFNNYNDKIYSLLEDHVTDGIAISESYLRLGSTGFNSVTEFYRNAYDNKRFTPTNEADKFILEKLQTGKSGYLKDGDKYTKVALDTPMRNKGGDKSFKVYRAGKGEHEGLPIVKTITWGMDDPKSGRSSVKNDDKVRSDSFFARHKCSTKKDKDSAGWWACYAPELFGSKLKLAGGNNRW